MGLTLNTLLLLSTFCCLLATPIHSASIRSNRNVVLFPRKDEMDFAKSVSNANLQFSLDILKKLAESRENIAFSPFGIAAAFGIVSLAAQGKTLDEIEKALHYTEINDNNSSVAINSIYKDFIRNMKRAKGRDGDFASAIFTHSTCGISPVFGRQAIDLFQSDIQQLDFKFKKPAVDTINKWVAKETHNKISSIVTEDSIHPDTLMMLVNAVYFKGKWEQPFNVSSTKDMDFFLLNKQKVTVKMMRKSGDYYHGFDTETDSRVMILPYKDSKLSMAILLPRTNDGLPQLIQKLTPEMVKRMISNLTLSQLLVDLPRFKLETDYSLNRVMSQLGINDLFTSKASVSGIFCNQTLHVNQMLHKTSIEVDESGTTAASITAMDLIPLSKPLSFTVNHPFLFTIFDHESEVGLFLGAVFNFP